MSPLHSLTRASLCKAAALRSSSATSHALSRQHQLKSINNSFYCRRSSIRIGSMATLANFQVPAVSNEPNLHYEKDSHGRKKLAEAIASFQKKSPVQIPVAIGTKHNKDSNVKEQYDPSSHSTIIAKYATASKQDINTAIEEALKAKSEWENLPFADRAAVFLKAADLVAGKYRYDIMAATIVGQGKNAWQAEIDAAAELADFLRFNVKYAEQLYSTQPVHNSPNVWNRVEYRPLEGFVYAISPFNFTAIGGNLCAAPALMGNVVIWKPSDYAVAANWITYQILLEAGLPPDVIQFCPGDPVAITEAVLSHKDFAALHYTGSTAVFRQLYGQIGKGVAEGKYRQYPRIVGETGGKNFHLIHQSAHIDSAVANTVRGAFEYQGQKCSATSRIYVAKSIWPEFKEKLVAATKTLKVGPPSDFNNFIGPVIHKGAFTRLQEAIDSANKDSSLTKLVGGTYDSSKGYFVNPTIYEAKEANHELFSRELFGPVLVAYVYDDAPSDSLAKIAKVIDSTSDYALTGSVFAGDRAVIRQAENALRNSAGNFYINCKSTGAVVGQQPFGGARASGTNDKAGSANLLARFVSMRSVKEELVGNEGVLYPSNEV